MVIAFMSKFSYSRISSELREERSCDFKKSSKHERTDIEKPPKNFVHIHYTTLNVQRQINVTKMLQKYFIYVIFVKTIDIFRKII